MKKVSSDKFNIKKKSSSEFTTDPSIGSSTETGGRGFGTTEMTYYYSATDPDIYKKEEPPDSSSRRLGQDVIDILVELGNGMDNEGESSLANFADFLISKFASAEEDVDYAIMFNKIITRVMMSEYIENRNEICKKLAKIYSNTLMIEFDKNKDINSAKKSAYKKTLHRAEQYLSEA